MFMLEFLKKVFGNKAEINTSVPSSYTNVQVPESVLDRFLLNCPEFYYFEPGNNNKIVFLMKGKEAKIGGDPKAAGISIMALMWLRNIYKSNNALFMSIIKEYQGETSISDDSMKKQLWLYYRTGHSTHQPQLTTFYQRGSGIVKFIDSLLPYSHLVFDESNSKSICDYVNQQYGSTSTLSNTTSISAEEYAKIIIRDMHMGVLGEKKQNSDADIFTSFESLENIKHVRPKMPRQQKRSKGTKPYSGQTDYAYLLIFSASWCGPSKRFVKEIEEAGIHNYTYIDVDQDWTEQLVEKYGVFSIPLTVLIQTNGDLIKKWVGYDDKDTGQSKFVTYIRNCNYNIIPFQDKKI